MSKSLTALGRYEIIGVLATGGMAEVLLARVNGPSGFERPVVIKRILPHLTREAVFRDMFLEESRIIARIRNRNVVAVHELGQEGHELYLVMEYLEGESLASIQRRLRVAKRSMPLHLGAYITAEACAGLHAAHELTGPDGASLNIVHRDVSPHNVFVQYDGQVKVIDFGIAKAADSQSKTQTGQIKGKFSYMAPEQVRAEPLDRRADIFALGIVLQEITTGQRLFERDHDLLVFKALVEDPIAKPSQQLPGYPASLEAVCEKALARDLASRYPTAIAMRKELLAAMKPLVGDEPVEEELGALMRDLFVERFERKRDLVARIQRGAMVTTVAFADAESFPTGGDPRLAIPVAAPSSPGSMPGAPLSQPGAVSSSGAAALSPNPSSPGLPAPPLSHPGAALPVLGDPVTGTNGPLLTTNGPVELAPRRRSPLFFAIPAMALIGVAGAVLFSRQSAAPPSAETAVLATPVSSVTIQIVSQPAGAAVSIAGVGRGVTPLTIALDKSDAAVTLELSHEGFEGSRQELSPNTDQRVAITLTPRATSSAGASAEASAKSAPALGPATNAKRPVATAAPKPTAPTTATAKPTSGFGRFD